MLIYLIFLIIIFVAIVINEGNAKYILSGYNSMSEIKRRDFNLTQYLSFFKRHLFSLAFSYLFIGLFLQYLVGNEIIFNAFSVLYPIAGLFFLIYKSLDFYKGGKRERYMILIIGIGTVIAITVAIGVGVNKPTIKVEDHQLHISGPYGGSIPYSEIVKVEKGALPAETTKINGFQLGNIRKGTFKLRNDEIVTVICTENDSCLIITTKSNKFIIDYDRTVENFIKNQ